MQGGTFTTILHLPVIEGQRADSLKHEIYIGEHSNQSNKPEDNSGQHKVSKVATLPPELATLLATLQSRVSLQVFRSGIIKLCAWQTLTGEELATLLQRDRHYLRNKHLIPMVKEGQLALLYPDNPNHPQQAYTIQNKKIHG